MNIVLVIICGILGSWLGSSFNYYLGLRFGRSFLHKYGKYMFLTSERLDYIDSYFAKHGEITTLVGRMIPVVRQYISFPAGLARMNFAKFSLYTVLGASVWVVILAMLGRTVGNNIDLVKEHLHTIVLVTIPALALVVLVYVIAKKRKSNILNKEGHEQHEQNEQH
jgi:membrane protein DedA with SNARE-associated domain